MCTCRAAPTPHTARLRRELSTNPLSFGWSLCCLPLQVSVRACGALWPPPPSPSPLSLPLSLPPSFSFLSSYAASRACYARLASPHHLAALALLRPITSLRSPCFAPSPRCARLASPHHLAALASRSLRCRRGWHLASLEPAGSWSTCTNTRFSFNRVARSARCKNKRLPQKPKTLARLSAFVSLLQRLVA